MNLERNGENYAELEELFEKNQASINEGNEDNFFIEVVCRHLIEEQTRNDKTGNQEDQG